MPTVVTDPQELSMARALFARERTAVPITDPEELTMARGLFDVQQEQYPQVQDFARGLVQGVTFNYGDEIRAGVNAALEALTDDEDSDLTDLYAQELAQIRSQLTQAREENPDLFLSGQVASMLSPGAFYKIPRLLNRAVSRATGLGARAGRVATEAIMGGVGGAAAVTGRQRDKELTDQALLGGIIGAATGGTLGYAGDRVSEALQRRSRIRRASSQEDVPRDVLEQLDQLGLTSEEVANLRRRGANALTAEGGPRLTAELDTAIQSGREATEVGQEAIAGRVRQAARGAKRAVSREMGAPRGFTRRTPEQAARTRELYDIAHAQMIDYDTEAGQSILSMLQERVPKRAIAEANAMLRAEGKAALQMQARATPEGLVFEGMPNVAQIDYITRGISAVARKEQGKGGLGGQTQLGRIYQNLAREIKQKLDESNEALRTVREEYGKSIGGKEAEEFGETLIKQSVTRQFARDAIDEMSQTERLRAIVGMRRNIDDIMAKARATLSAGTELDIQEGKKLFATLQNRATKQKIAMLLGARPTARLYKELSDLYNALGLQSATTAGSQTFRRLAVAERLRDRRERGSAFDLNPSEVVRNILRRRRGARSADEQLNLVRALTQIRAPQAIRLNERLRGTQGINLRPLARGLTGAASRAAALSYAEEINE